MDLNPRLKFYTLRQVAASFLVSPSTVKTWCRNGILTAQHQVISGRSYRLLFSEAELLRFAEENFPTSADLEFSNLRSSNAESIKRIINMHRLYTGRAQAAGLVKLYERAGKR